jgi:hypothetical protein
MAERLRRGLCRSVRIIQPEEELTSDKIPSALDEIASNIDSAQIGLKPYDNPAIREKLLRRTVGSLIRRIRKTGMDETNLFISGYRLGRSRQKQQDWNEAHPLIPPR